MLDAAALIAKHQGRSVLIETNLLVLFPVGTVNRKRIVNFKRTDDLFKSLVEKVEEVRDASLEVVKNPVFRRFGLTDAAIAAASARGLLVITTDAPLHLALQQRGIDAVNFNHVRVSAWR